MCGLVGVMGDYLLDKHKKAFHELFWSSAIRGYDSSGIIQVTHLAGKTCYETIKGILPSPWLLASKEGRAIISKPDVKALFGHCRAKTIGESKYENAHPFTFDNVVGMHNGTLHGKYPYESNYETDSEALYRSINDHGIAETVSELDGAWALSWFDKQKCTVNFLRNKERDIWFANEKHTDVLFWASEPGLLRWVLSRNGIDFDKVVLLTPDTLISFDITVYRPSRSIKRSIAKRKERPVSTNSHPFFGGALLPWSEYVHANDPESDGVTNATDGLQKEKTVSSTISRTSTIDKVYYGYKGELLSPEELEELLVEGCIYCGEQPKLGESVRWISPSDFFCRYCRNSKSFDYTKSSLKMICN